MNVCVCVCVSVCVCVCVCVCVHPRAMKNYTLEMNLYMALAINITDGHGLSNKARCEFLLLKKAR